MPHPRDSCIRFLRFGARRVAAAGPYRWGPVSTRARATLSSPARAAALAGVAVAFAGSMTTWFDRYVLDFGTYPMANPLVNVRDGAITVATMVDEGRLDAEIGANRARLQDDYAIDPASLEALAGHTVHVDPSETRAAWAYGLDWEPIPIFQPYAAWTEALGRQYES